MADVVIDDKLIKYITDTIVERFQLDLLVFTPAEIEEERQMLGSVVRLAEREGEVLYERS
jgi:hypothetical protein